MREGHLQSIREAAFGLLLEAIAIQDYLGSTDRRGDSQTELEQLRRIASNLSAIAEGTPPAEWSVSSINTAHLSFNNQIVADFMRRVGDFGREIQDRDK